MANKAMRDAIREEIRRRRGGGGKPDRGPMDLVKADRDAGPNIHRDETTWTVATPEEFRRGMQVEPSRPPEHTVPSVNDEKKTDHNIARMKGRPAGRLSRVNELQQALAQRIREAETDEERGEAEQDYRDMIDEEYDRRMQKRKRGNMQSSVDFSGRRRGS
jgi:hypothetical protein